VEYFRLFSGRVLENRLNIKIKICLICFFTIKYILSRSYFLNFLPYCRNFLICYLCRPKKFKLKCSN
jgi:hypothetical protein